MTDIARIKQDTLGVYDRQAQDWDAGRSQAMAERPWLDRLLGGLELPCDVLDLGCGTGKPIAGYLLGHGHRVVGIDGSAQMIRLAKANYPSAVWHQMDMRAVTLSQRFDAILSWDGFFHLSPEEQRDVLPALCALLRPRGRIMLTVGHVECETTGQVYGETVYHGSLSTAEYLRILGDAGLPKASVKAEQENGLDRTVLFAEKPAERG